jgi:PTS system ascorbate-specific IIB component
LKILAVCGMGFGSSLVLRMTIESVLRELGVKADVVTSDIGTAKSESADLIVTSAEFSQLLKHKGVPILEIINYVDKQEMKQKLMEVLSK